MADTQTPTLTSDQKLKLVLAQRDVLAAKVNVNAAETAYTEKMNALNTAANAVATELGIDPSKWAIDMDTLVLQAK